jgi:hypothetical protein
MPPRLVAFIARPWTTEDLTKVSPLIGRPCGGEPIDVGHVDEGFERLLAS